METFTIGKLAKITDTSIDTIRYYEQIGLLPEAKRRNSGYRLFNGIDIKKVNFIKKAKTLGFSLKEIKELLLLRIDSKSNCDDVKEHAQNKLEFVEKKIYELEHIEKVLKKLINQCTKRLPTNDCPIIEALEDDIVLE